MKSHERQKELFTEWLEDSPIAKDSTGFGFLQFYSNEVLELMYAAYLQGKEDNEWQNNHV